MTEHAAVIFVFFFLAEYASILLICILTSILFLGGYLMNISAVLSFIDLVCYSAWYLKYLVEEFNGWVDIILYGNTFYDRSEYEVYEAQAAVMFELSSYPLVEGMISGLVLGLKSCVMIFIFIWARASFPRIRYDQLMSFCWTILLPLVISFIILLPCVLYSFDTIASNIIFL